MEKISKGIIIAGDWDDAFESSAIARKALNQEIETSKFFKNSLDVLAHQIIGLLFEFRRPKPKEIFSIISRCYPYRTLSYEEFLSVCKFLEAIGLIFFDDTLKLRRRSFEHYFSQLSTIPSTKQYKIINSLTNKVIGSLDEEFIGLHAEIGASFIVKGEVWKILEIDENKVWVEPSKDLEAAIPVWVGELLPVPFEVAQEVGRLREFIASNLSDKKSLRSKLLETYPIDKRTAEKMIKTIEKQSKESIVPTDRLILIEEEKDMCIIHACFGSNVNETLGRVLSALLASKIGAKVDVKSDAYRIIFHSSFKKAERLKEILKSLKPEFLESYLDLVLPNSNLFEWKFLHVARRFGVIKEEAEYSRSRLRRLIEEFRGTPLFKETLNEIKIEKLEIGITKKVLEDIQNGKIEVKIKNGISFLGRIALERYFGDIVFPKKAEKEILSIFKQRLLDTKMLFVCLNCGRWAQTFAIKDLPKDLRCKVCGARLIAPLKTKNPEILKFVRKALRKNLTQEEREKFKRMEKRANLFLTYGKKVALVMAARGVGSETAKRILSKFYRDENELFKEILEAERKYLLTKKFWRL
ncbi:MAG TPA: hypothetical protein ENF38_01840 [Candidatus Aenigmarchaeota archaeon]|nr:hypothetical protein [Candidatus Aenigmarchaeota archaeon]